MKYFIPIITRQFIGNVTCMEQMIKKMLVHSRKSPFVNQIRDHRIPGCWV